MSSKTPVAILGATGMVGQRLANLLVDHPWFEAKTLAASERSAGKPYNQACAWHLDTASHAGVGDHTVVSCDADAITKAHGGPGLAISALPSGVAKTLEIELAERGWAVVSNASSHRMDPRVPLIIPEVNADHLELVHDQPWKGSLITNPNCTSMPLTIALAPIHRTFGLVRACIASYQAVSGAGYPGESAWDMLANVRPHPGDEEEKLAIEPAKILGTRSEGGIEAAPFVMSARCVRVPVVDGHLVAAQVETQRPVSPEEAIAAMTSWKGAGLQLPSSPDPIIRYDERRDRPQPRFDSHHGKGMAVTVGRVEACPVMGLKFFTLAHNTLRGAAGAALLNAELLHSKGLLPA